MKERLYATIQAIHDLSHDTKSFLLRAENPFTFKTGQFIMVNVPFKKTYVRRAYSLASMPDSGRIELCLDYVKGGKASEYFFNLKVGEKLLIDGPYGVFTLKESDKEKFFICTGTGVAPFRAMIQQLAEQKAKENFTLIFGERTEEELLYRNEFESLAKKNSRFKYIVTLSRSHESWKGELGYVQHVMKKHIHADGEFYVCGLKQMVDDVKNELLGMGVQLENIFTEKYM